MARPSRTLQPGTPAPGRQGWRWMASAYLALAHLLDWAPSLAHASLLEPATDITNAMVSRVERWEPVPGSEPSIGPPGEGAQGQWHPVELPQAIQRKATTRAAVNLPLPTVWYRTACPVPAAQETLALYLPRVNGGPLQVWLRNAQATRQLLDNSPAWPSQWNQPILLRLPSAAAQPHGSCLLFLALPPRADGSYALSRLWLGAETELQSLWSARQRWVVTVPLAASTTLVMLGLFSLAFWWRRRKDTAYLYFGLASLAWWLRNLHYGIELPQNLDALRWFWWATDASMTWVMLLVYLFSLRFATRRFPWVERLLLGFAVLVSAMSMPFLPWALDTPLLLHAANTLVAMGVTLLIAGSAWRGSRELRVLALALCICLGLGVHDLALLQLRISPESLYLMPYAMVLVLGAFLYAVNRRYISALEHAEGAAQVLQDKLSEQQRALQGNFALLAEVENERVRLTERQRLTRDMHDGLGAMLVSSLGQMEQGRLSQGDVAQVLRDCLEDLRLTIDSMEPIDQDLTTLLATLRQRVGHRLAQGGITLHWHMDDLPPLPWLDAPAALHVLRIVQEALANVVKHSGAANVTLSATVDTGPGVCVQIEDDGRGLPSLAGNTPGRGLNHIDERARQLGGHARILPGHLGGTVVQLWLPLEGPPPPATDGFRHSRWPAP
ncbi:sensor histidine kinase [Acidovorax sp. Root217]|uniref:sensor histidine kinase n=1 Tax=Acidovorax sp. Root217 TaxID=1736492 RepID=UPI000AD0D7DA|nr:sensor histidine kinase [Acidovorax sp. Root217]